MISLRTIAPLLLLLSIAFSSHAQEIKYNDLVAHERADLARYLGWVWGDGKPGFNETGILYKGGNPNYSAVVRRLAKIDIGGNINPFRFPVSGNLKHAPDVWDYWNNSLPGGNPGDPEILRQAIRHPNFLAGIIEGEGQGGHSNPNWNYYIADQYYSPSNPDPDKIYDVVNFGPERVIQLFSLLQETYMFTNPTISIQKNGKKYQYDTERCEVIEKIREKYSEVKENNESGNSPKGFPVKIYVNPNDFPTIRDYGYFRKSKGDYRTPAPDSDLIILPNIQDTDDPATGENAEVSGPMTFFNNEATTRFVTENGDYLNSNLDIVPLTNNDHLDWKLVDLNNGFYRIESQDNSITNNWIQAVSNEANNTLVRLADASSTWHQTQWEKIPVTNMNDQYYLKNRHFGTYLRVGTSSSTLKHGGAGPAARWTLEEIATCTQ